MLILCAKFENSAPINENFNIFWRPFWKIATTAELGEIHDGSTSYF